VRILRDSSGDEVGAAGQQGTVGAAAGAQPPASPASAAAPAGGPDEPIERGPETASASLRRRRDALAAEVTEMHWDLGGLAYEMAIRDHFRLDVLVRRAALLQERDAELAEVERLLRMEEDGVAGTCPTCAAPHSRGALYCWQCGTTLMERTPSSSVAQPPTGDVLDALLAAPAPQAPPAPGQDGGAGTGPQ
jgi:hypothetical protein